MYRHRCRCKDNIIMDVRNRVGSCELDTSGSGQGPVAGSCELGNEHLHFIKGGEFLD
jgi:hypothetical protein